MSPLKPFSRPNKWVVIVVGNKGNPRIHGLDTFERYWDDQVSSIEKNCAGHLFATDLYQGFVQFNDRRPGFDSGLNTLHQGIGQVVVESEWDDSPPIRAKSSC